MSYLTIPNELFGTADAAKRYLSSEFGLRKIQTEASFDDSIDYRPTFYSISRDQYIISLDVAESIYNPTRWNFINSCEKQGIPIKFYVAIPSTSYADFATHLKQAKQNGVGVIEIAQGHPQRISSAVSLTLTGLRQFDKGNFPKKHREVISQAEDTYRNGEPNKACSIVYDEIEMITRKIALKSYNAGLWSETLRHPDHLLDRIAWAHVIQHLQDDFDPKPVPYDKLRTTLLSSLHGITELRNDSGHNPASRKKRMERDLQLRTRLEAAVDLLQRLIDAARPIKV